MEFLFTFIPQPDFFSTLTRIGRKRERIMHWDSVRIRRTKGDGCEEKRIRKGWSHQTSQDTYSASFASQCGWILCRCLCVEKILWTFPLPSSKYFHIHFSVYLFFPREYHPQEDLVDFLRINLIRFSAQLSHVSVVYQFLLCRHI